MNSEQFQRSAGVLLHITSIPSSFGIGDLGASSRRFVEFLHRAGQKIWQVLPLGPTVTLNSPYSCYSAFAGNPLLISLEDLVEDELLSQAQLEQYHHSFLSGLNEEELPAGHNVSKEVSECKFELATAVKTQALQDAFANFRAKTSCEVVDHFEGFCTHNRFWLDDFALFAALMQHFGTPNWIEWDPALVRREPEALGHWKQTLAKEFEYEQFVQYLFFKQWNRLRECARVCDVQLFGDMPIFVSHGSADVWANQKFFCLEPDGKPYVVAGVPPDYFAKDGQLWGNPLYNWNTLAEHQYSWWTDRFRVAFQMFDLLRIDHFRGFEAYWEVPASAKTARSGQWVKGPCAEPFRAAEAALGKLPIIAEDLGMITDEVHSLRDELQFPGMRVFQFGFDQVVDDYHRPNSYPEISAAYTGTHDNATIAEWLDDHREQEVFGQLMAEYLPEVSVQDLSHWDIIRLVYESPAALAIVPLQDLLGLGEESRMNIPGKAHGNWGWRCMHSHFSDQLANGLRDLSVRTNRFAESPAFVG